MKNINVIDGQIDLFNLPIQEPVKPKEKIIVEKLEIKEDKFKEIINLYKDSCKRIVKRVSGTLLVGLEDKTMYFTSQGINEFDLSPDVGLMPADEIILANEDKELNDLQLKKLNGIKVTEYIKRKGDSNIIIPGEKTIVINPKGWVIDYEQKPNFKEDEVVILENSMKLSNEELKIGDTVEFEYEKKKEVGKISSIYNNGETINVAWNHKHTAFYYKCVKKIA